MRTSGTNKRTTLSTVPLIFFIGAALLLQRPEPIAAETTLSNGYFVAIGDDQRFDIHFDESGALFVSAPFGNFEGRWEVIGGSLCVEFQDGPMKDKRRPLSLALQGAIDALLVDNCVRIEAISGTSAGAMNGTTLAAGLVRGGPAEARSDLHRFWQAVEADGFAYWDGGYVGNPALLALIRLHKATEFVPVQTNPFRRENVPKTGRDIVDRLNEITFNSALLKELWVIVIHLTFLVFGFGIAIKGVSPADTVTYFGDGFWNLLGFSMQMALILFTGFILASSRWRRPGTIRDLVW